MGEVRGEMERESEGEGEVKGGMYIARRDLKERREAGKERRAG